MRRRAQVDHFRAGGNEDKLIAADLLARVSSNAATWCTVRLTCCPGSLVTYPAVFIVRRGQVLLISCVYHCHLGVFFSDSV